MSLNDDVRRYWEREPCGTSRTIVGDLPERVILDEVHALAAERGTREREQDVRGEEAAEEVR